MPRAPDPTFSFMPRSNPPAIQSSDRQLRLDDLNKEPTRDSPYPVSKSFPRTVSPLRTEDGNKERNSSKAVAGAMKALQEKIKRLEAVNERLRTDLEALELKFVKDRERWQEQSHRDLEDSKDKESLVLGRMEALEEDLRKQKLKEISMEELVKSLTKQIQAQEAEEDRDQNSAKMRETALEDRIQMMAKQLEQKDKELQLFERNLSSLEKDRSRLSAENNDLSFQLTKLNSELDYLKQSGESSKSTFISKMQETDQQMAKKIEAFADRVNELEMRNQHLTDLTVSKENQVEFLKQELEEVKKSNAASESARMAASHESEKARKLVQEVAQTNERLTHSMRELEYSAPRPYRKGKIRTTSASRSKSPKTSKRLPPSSENRPTRELSDSLSHAQDSDVSSRISQLERDLKRQNEDYKAVLQQAETMDLSRLRTELNGIAEEMEAKSKELATLRRQQQNSIREQVRDAI